MQGMVPEFEKFLEREGTSDERRLYNDVGQFLTKALGRPIDLEAAFTLIDSIVNWDVERLGVSALYHASKALPTGKEEKVLAFTAPTQDETRVARALRRKFELFVQRICQIPTGNEIGSTPFIGAYSRMSPGLPGNRDPDGTAVIRITTGRCSRQTTMPSSSTTGPILWAECNSIQGFNMIPLRKWKSQRPSVCGTTVFVSLSYTVLSRG